MSKSNHKDHPTGISRREFLKGGASVLLLTALGGSALNLIGCGGKTESEHDLSEFHQPAKGEIAEVDSPWYKVEGGSFSIIDKDGANARWNPAYGGESEAMRNGGVKSNDIEYYGALDQGQTFSEVDQVIKAGSYQEDIHDENGQLLGYKEMEYIGISADDFIKNLPEDDSFRFWLEERVGLTDDDVIFIASGKTDIEIGDILDGIPEYHRSAK